MKYTFKKKVRHLVEGDVLSPTGAVVVCAGQPSTYSKGYWYLVVHYPGKELTTQVTWKPDTTVSVQAEADLTVQKGSDRIRFSVPGRISAEAAMRLQTAAGYSPAGYGFGSFNNNAEEGRTTWNCFPSCD